MWVAREEFMKHLATRVNLQLPSGMKLCEDLRGHYRLISCKTRIISLHNRMLQELFFPAMQLYSELPVNPYSRIPNKSPLSGTASRGIYRVSPHSYYANGGFPTCGTCHYVGK